jgi:hypothetical protein
MAIDYRRPREFLPWQYDVMNNVPGIPDYRIYSIIRDLPAAHPVASTCIRRRSPAHR